MEIVKDSRKLDQKDYKKFFDQHYTTMCQFANHFLNDLENSKDVVQEAFIYLWQKHNDLDNTNYLKGYLYKTIRHKCLNVIRNSKVVERTKNELEYLSSDLFFKNAMIEEETYHFIFEKISQLPEMQRKVMELHIDGLSNEDIAESLNLTVNTVRTHKQRARVSLKKDLNHLIELLIIIFLHQI